MPDWQEVVNVGLGSASLALPALGRNPSLERQIILTLFAIATPEPLHNGACA